VAKTALKKTDSAESKTKKVTRPKKTKKAKTKVQGDVTPAIAKACKIKGCKRAYRAKGYCRTHYKKWRHGEYGKVRYKHCSDVSCFKPMAKNRHGFCEDHFQNYYVKGLAQAKVPAAAKPAADEKGAAAEKAS
jgi:hypothetical protein